MLPTDVTLRFQHTTAAVVCWDFQGESSVGNIKAITVLCHLCLHMEVAEEWQTFQNKGAEVVVGRRSGERNE